MTASNPNSSPLQKDPLSKAKAPLSPMLYWAWEGLVKEESRKSASARFIAGELSYKNGQEPSESARFIAAQEEVGNNNREYPGTWKEGESRGEVRLLIFREGR